MRNLLTGLSALALATAATPAFAQSETDPPSPITISGSATVVSDYRFRGFSQSNEKAAIQGGFAVTHDSGLYIGTWGSSIGFNNGTEIDVYGGFSKELTPGLTGDIGATLYLYPGSSNTSVIEPYASLTGTLGPASLKGGVAWAPSGQVSLGKDSGIYVYGDLAVGVPTTPIKLKAHLGYAESDSFLGGADGKVIDYSLGAELNWKALTLGIAYINTDEPTALGYKKSIGADGAVVFSIGAAF
ncbi:MAG: TorF family putative porin [Sphingomonas sp.]|uniref:TorF family putative porin n=1 Tax=Sphingomonas sp. TaxID=28214 RepID=UPI0025DA1972|nr:TorF family putative porin [Sphingomonas sp.]MBX3565720.1 TorF family putative porin [Sphingomonas sp.]